MANNNLLQAAQQFMGQVIQNNQDQNLMNVPWKQDAMNAIMSGDQTKGQELAQNILNSYGFSSPEEAIQKGLQNLSQRK